MAPSRRPLAVDLCTGLHGWAEGLTAEGWRVRGYDIEDMCAAVGEPRPADVELVLQSILELNGADCADADLIVASPPCQEFSYMAMPWTRAKQIARALRGEDVFPEPYNGSRTVAELTALFDACFRIQREASEAAGRRIPMVVENVKGAQPWVGRAAWNFGSYYLYGDVPALMPSALKTGVKVGGMGWYPPDDPRHQVGAAFNPGAQGKAFSEAREGRKNGGGSWFAIGSPGQLVTNPVEGRKNPGFRFDGSGRSFQSESVERHVEAALKGVGGSWFGAYQPGQNMQRNTSSGSSARKAASARIAKIPLPLSTHIARVYHPQRAAA